MNTQDLHGKVALITGGSRGIGRACASLLAERGASVVITSRDNAAAARAASELAGERGLGIAADVVDEDAARAAVLATIEHFGSLDILVNNVGIGARESNTFGPLTDVRHAGFSKTMDVNLWGSILWSGLAWEHWMQEHGGNIVNISSQAALDNASNIAIYSASKSALMHITRYQALEFAPGVRVNGVAPGVVRTELAEEHLRNVGHKLIAGTPLGRLGEPKDVAEAVAFLTSDASSWVTGQTLLMDGGALLKGTI